MEDYKSIGLVKYGNVTNRYSYGTYPNMIILDIEPNQSLKSIVDILVEKSKETGKRIGRNEKTSEVRRALQIEDDWDDGSALTLNKEFVNY